MNSLELKLASIVHKPFHVGTNLDTETVYIYRIRSKDGKVIFRNSCDLSIKYEDSLEDYIAKILSWEFFLLAIKHVTNRWMAIWLDRICRSDFRYWKMFEGFFWEGSKPINF